MSFGRVLRKRTIARAVLLVSATAIALAISVPSASPAQAVNPDDFAFESMNVEYTLSRDEAGHSTLETTETLVALFPEFNQNHGIRRAIPLKYEGRPTGLEILDVTDGSGESLEYEYAESDGFGVVTIAADDFVQGRMAYVLSYRQRDVTLATPDGWEFYWDVNGTGWPQSFGEVTATVRFGDGLLDEIAGDASCYQGGYGDVEPCDVSATDDALLFRGTALEGFETVTVNVPFRPGSFTPRDNSFWASPFAALAAGGLGALGLLAAGAWLFRWRRWRDAPGRGTIIAEYDWPDGVDVFEAAELWGTPRKAPAAFILKLAVSGVAVLRESTKRHFELELLDSPKPVGRRRLALRSLSDAEAQVRDALFAFGPVCKLRSKSTKFAAVIELQRAEARHRAITSGLRHRPELGARIALAVLAGALALLTLGASFAVNDDGRGGALPVVIALGGLACAALVGIAVWVRPLTAAGRAARDHLAGLREFLTVTEAERIEQLQGPASTERDERGRLDLYESLLPAAVLLGVDEQWSRVLADQYQTASQSPDWYSGTGAFTPSVLAGTIGGISASVAWVDSAGASGSSGSGGGGFAGGGGGGGGGGGV